MTPIFFFFNLCIAIAGAEDCSFEWQILPQEEIQRIYTGDREGDVGGFVDGNKIFASSIKILIHERKHVVCILENTDETLRDLCHFRVDMEYIVQGHHEIDETPEPPTISEKMKYTQRFW